MDISGLLRFDATTAQLGNPVIFFNYNTRSYDHGEFVGLRSCHRPNTKAVIIETGNGSDLHTVLPEYVWWAPKTVHKWIVVEHRQIHDSRWWILHQNLFPSNETATAWVKASSRGENMRSIPITWDE